MWWWYQSLTSLCHPLNLTTSLLSTTVTVAVHLCVCVCVCAQDRIYTRERKKQKPRKEKKERTIVCLWEWNAEREKHRMWEKEKNGEIWELGREIQCSYVCVQNVQMCVCLKGHRLCYFLPMFPSLSHTHTQENRLWGPAAMQCDDRVVWLPRLPSGGRTRRAAGAPRRLIGWRSTRTL